MYLHFGCLDLDAVQDGLAADYGDRVDAPLVLVGMHESTWTMGEGGLKTRHGIIDCQESFG